ncbi:hypothetical protein [Streptomyces sp. SID3343]|uniref:hypothetical protein n=1 Tax=Streptomyces sp. SID3343 TaxID=2690260 RepID=UPI00136A1CC5|nr:hypothetical protein [Streptomyces sp. SID3343]MYV99937.1 hypothetical protein [Streptomyces sp. SID3343]
MGVRELDAVAALAPPETEFATTTAVHRVAAGETGLAGAVEGLALVGRVYTLAVCTVVMLLEAFGRATAPERIDEQVGEYERTSHPRSYPIA